MVGDGAATLVARAFAAGGCRAAARCPDALPCDLQRAPAEHTRGRIEGVDEVLDGARAARCRSPCSPTSRSRPRAESSTGSISRGFSAGSWSSAATARCRASPIRRDSAICDARRRRSRQHPAGRRFGRRLADGAGGRNARLPRRATGSGSRALPRRVPPGRRRGRSARRRRYWECCRFSLRSGWRSCRASLHARPRSIPKSLDCGWHSHC